MSSSSDDDWIQSHARRTRHGNAAAPPVPTRRRPAHSTGDNARAPTLPHAGAKAGGAAARSRRATQGAHSVPDGGEGRAAVGGNDAPSGGDHAPRGQLGVGSRLQSRRKRRRAEERRRIRQQAEQWRTQRGAHQPATDDATGSYRALLLGEDGVELQERRGTSAGSECLQGAGMGFQVGHDTTNAPPSPRSDASRSSAHSVRRTEPRRLEEDDVPTARPRPTFALPTSGRAGPGFRVVMDDGVEAGSSPLSPPPSPSASQSPACGIARRNYFTFPILLCVKCNGVWLQLGRGGVSASTAAPAACKLINWRWVSRLPPVRVPAPCAAHLRRCGCAAGSRRPRAH